MAREVSQRPAPTTPGAWVTEETEEPAVLAARVTEETAEAAAVAVAVVACQTTSRR
jgi:hypothetical protein